MINAATRIAQLLTILLGTLATASAQKPNIVLIVSDDHGTDALGCYGNPVIKTPALDALSAEGTLFTDANCTTASCSPSRSVILTGLHNHRNGQYGLQHTFHHYQSFDDTVSLPVALRKNGYRTARIGKFHVAPDAVFDFDIVFPREPPMTSKRLAEAWEMAVNRAQLSRSKAIALFPFLCYRRSPSLKRFSA